MINVRLTPELIEQLRQIAAEQHQTVSSFARQSILRNIQLWINVERRLFSGEGRVKADDVVDFRTTARRTVRAAEAFNDPTEPDHPSTA